MRGGKRTPAELMREGRKKRALLRIVPPALIADISCPNELQGAARDEWTRVAPLLRDMRILADVDRSVLAQYCLCWQRVKTAEAYVLAEGAVRITRKRKPARSPWYVILQEEERQLRQWASELGISASSRSRMDVTKTTSAEALEAERRSNLWYELASQ